MNVSHLLFVCISGRVRNVFLNKALGSAGWELG